MNASAQELIQAWLIFPLLFVLVSTCLGMAVFRVSRFDLKSLLVLPAGFSALIVLGQMTTLSPDLAKYTPAIFLVCTSFCLVYFAPELIIWLKANMTNLILGLSVFYLHGLPILMSKTPTFAGWIKLDDGASWLAIADQMLKSGRDTASLSPSTHEAITQILLNSAGDMPYPAGSFVPLGVLSRWLFIDSAWILQPYMAAAAMVLSISLLALLRPIQIPTWSKILTAGVAPTSALFLGYEMWGGIKEMLLVPLLVLIFALIPLIAKRPNEPRRVIPFALACSAYVLIFSLSGLVWLSMPIIFLVVALISYKKTLPWQHALFFICTFLVASLAALFPLIKSPTFLLNLLSFAQSSTDIGNLLGSLKFSQIFGIWLTGDFRYPPEYPFVNTALVILCGLLFLLGCYCLISTGSSHIGALGIWVTLLSVIALNGNAWISGKTLAMASPIVLAIAFCAIGFVANKFAFESAVLAVTLTCGVLISYAHIYHEVWLAPYEQLKELEVIGQNKSYQGPALMTEFSPYGARHFLRDLDAESAGELRRNLIPLRNGKGLEKGQSADIDEFPSDSIDEYQTLVLRRSPISSRPPGNYELTFSGTYYEVWQKNPNGKLPIHFPLGTADSPNAFPDCEFVRSEIATQMVSYDVRISSGKEFVKLESANITGEIVEPGGKSVFESKFEAARSGKFDVWMAGFSKGRAEVFIDDLPVVVTSHVLNQTSTFSKIGEIQLETGPHVLKIATDSLWIIPGSGGFSYPIGPIYLSDHKQKYSVTTVNPDEINTLCTKPMDWIELVPR